ncbi:glycosyltransferase [Paraliomyxa miuraensis]|uniref:glycosyltransferase n=1 Tax=Paraliomyxa miuraensis TaxID=376150 RepID=UPI00224E8E56|nr:glycosyltransferase [Paraliomyxa miuraensis]MCX4248061.1 glycosyltransferase [Paraliomyxa miuraensis]
MTHGRSGASSGASGSPTRTVLLVSRWFPPAFQIGGKRAFRFARYLPDHGWRPIVWTGAHPDEVPHDRTPIALPESVVVDRTLIPRWWPEPRRRLVVGADITPGHGMKPPGSLGRLRRGLTMPVAEELVLMPLLLRRLTTLVERYRPDVLMATSSPYWTLVLGRLAAARHGLPLVLDLRDPWTPNFLQEHKAGWVRRVECSVERRCLAAAARVTFTAPATTAAYQALYPELASRLCTITNAFDPDQAPVATSRGDAPEGSERVLVHFGNCYGKRRLDGVLRGLATLRDEHGESLDSIRVLNLGKPDAEDVALAERLGVRLDVQPFLPLADGLALLAGADVQLLVGYGDEEMFIPAKLFDYLLSGAPILAVGRAQEVGRIVERTGTGLSVMGDDPSATARALRRLLAREHGPRDEAAVSTYAAPSTTRALARLLTDVVAER